MLDHTLVLWRTPRLDAGVRNERAVLGDARIFIETNRVLVECAGREIAVHVGDGETVLLESEYDRIRGVHLEWSCNSTVLEQTGASSYRTKFPSVRGRWDLPNSTPPKLSGKRRSHDANIVFPLPRKSLRAFVT